MILSSGGEGGGRAWASMHWQHCWFNVLSWHTNHGIGSSKQQNFQFTTAKMFFTIIWINVYKCLTISDFDKLIFDWLGGACVPASAIVCKCVYIAIDGIQTYVVTFPNRLLSDWFLGKFLFFLLVCVFVTFCNCIFFYPPKYKIYQHISVLSLNVPWWLPLMHAGTTAQLTGV